MDYIDISLPLTNQIVTYPSNVPFQREVMKNLAEHGVELSQLTLGTHTGTHIDAPRHFVKGGKGIDQIDLSKCIGPCKVVDCTYVEEFIREKDFEGTTIEKGDRILIKTRNSSLIKDNEFTPNFVSVSLEAAQFLANKEVALVGVDYLSIEAKGSLEHPVHKALLKHEIVVIEGLVLDRVEAREYQLICLPLTIVDSDGSPCRAILGKG